MLTFRDNLFLDELSWKRLSGHAAELERIWTAWGCPDIEVCAPRFQREVGRVRREFERRGTQLELWT